MKFDEIVEKVRPRVPHATARGINFGGDIPTLDTDDDNEAKDKTKQVIAGPPYYEEDKETVKLIQQKLVDLDYDVGPTGVDGKFGPYTIEAIKAYKKDNGIKTSEFVLTTKEIQMLMLNPKKATKPKKDVSPSVGAGDPVVADGDAKSVVEEFLGSSISDEEMTMLVKATAAEASPNARERAAVAAVILNRVRDSSYPNSISSVLNQRGQFQAITGVYDKKRGKWTGPSKNYTNMSKRTGEKVMQALVQYLPDMDKSWLNFTSNNPLAYGKGTNIGFMYDMRNSDGAEIIGQTLLEKV